MSHIRIKKSRARRIVVSVGIRLTQVQGLFEDQEVHSPAARALLEPWERDQVTRIAPALFAFATATAVRRCARAPTIPHQLGAGRAYDSLHAALAEAVGCEFWTGDQRFYHAAHPAYPWVRFVTEPAGA